jgi:hypothetical protein
VRRNQIIAVIVGIAASAVTMLGGTEAAAFPQKRVLPGACLDGSALPGDEVGVYDAGGVTITLRCGTPVSTGVLHIDDDHPIAPEQEYNFLRCVFNVFEEGAYLGPGNRPGLVVFQREFAPGRFAEGVYDDKSRDIVTLYTRGPVSNDWQACRGLP